VYEGVCDSDRVLDKYADCYIALEPLRKKQAALKYLGKDKGYAQNYARITNDHMFEKKSQSIYWRRVLKINKQYDA